MQNLNGFREHAARVDFSWSDGFAQNGFPMRSLCSGVSRSLVSFDCLKLCHSGRQLTFEIAKDKEWICLCSLDFLAGLDLVSRFYGFQVAIGWKNPPKENLSLQMPPLQNDFGFWWNSIGMTKHGTACSWACTQTLVFPIFSHLSFIFCSFWSRMPFWKSHCQTLFAECAGCWSGEAKKTTRNDFDILTRCNLVG